jgi:hypothetical protein
MVRLLFLSEVEMRNAEVRVACTVVKSLVTCESPK